MQNLQWTPKQLLVTSGAYWKSNILHSAVKLKLFDLLKESPLDCSQIAAKLQCETRGIEMLLNVLVAMELLTKSGNVYHNTAICEQCLVHGASHDLRHIIGHHQQLIPSWNQLTQTILSGSILQNEEKRGEAEIENFIMGMHNLASKTAPNIIPHLPLDEVTTILDLGGGPGSWSIGFCQALPTAKAQIADLATSRQFAERNIQKAQLENRISFIDLDFTKDKIIGTFDLIWISHILHSLSPENSEKLLKKARAQLNPGGKIMIHEFILDEEKTSPQQAVFFSLNMLVMTSAGKAYSERELTVLLKKIGGTKIKRISLPDSIPSGVITANFL